MATCDFTERSTRPALMDSDAVGFEARIAPAAVEIEWMLRCRLTVSRLKQP